MNSGVNIAVDDSTASDPHAVRQWLALNDRFLKTMGRHYEFVLCILAPILLTVCFYLPLRKVMEIYSGIDYAQFLMPIICLQSASFIATSAAMRSAMDETLGITTRLRSMPVNPFVPQLSRLSSNTVLLIVSLVSAMTSGLVIGWRPGSGTVNLLGFLLCALVVGMVFAFGADVIGTLTKSPESTSQAMALPTLILGMLSTGFVPEYHFPEWIQPFARNQPISQFANTMRAFDDGSISWGIILPALGWVLGLIAISVGVGLTLLIRSTRS